MSKKNILNVLGLEIKKRLALSRVANLVLEKSDVIIPVDTGNLRGSKYSRIYNNNNSVEVGYTAEYAKKVHENDKAKFKKPTAESRFLEKAMNSTRQERLDIIKRTLAV
jgi:hypothetical protein